MDYRIRWRADFFSRSSLRGVGLDVSLFVANVGIPIPLFFVTLIWGQIKEKKCKSGSIGSCQYLSFQAEIVFLLKPNQGRGSRGSMGACPPTFCLNGMDMPVPRLNFGNHQAYQRFCPPPPRKKIVPAPLSPKSQMRSSQGQSVGNYG